MRLAMIGLGRMGGNMSERLVKGGHEVVVFDRKPPTVQHYVSLGAIASTSLSDVTAKLKSPRIAWIMVPAGKPVDETIASILPGMSKGDVIIDGGNSNFHVKMIHNGIEYGMLQAYAEGYEILHASKEFKLDLHKIAAVWNHGSVVRSWLNELA